MPRRTPTIDVRAKSLRIWLGERASIVNSLVDDLSFGHFGDIMKHVAEDRGYLVLDKNKLMLSVANCIALRDYFGVANNGLQRLKQSIEALAPVLKGLLLPPNVHNKVGLVEKKGVILPCVVEAMLYTHEEG